MKTRGFTLVELLIVLAVIGILFSIVAPWVLAARRSAHEAAAISSLIAINDAQASFKEHCGHGRYAASLAGLGMRVPATGEGFLSPDLTSADPVVKSGYRFTMQAPSADSGPADTFPADSSGSAATRPACNGSDTVVEYVAIADPVRPGETGNRFFGTNASRVIYEHGETLTGHMPPAGAPDVGVELRR